MSPTQSGGSQEKNGGACWAMQPSSHSPSDIVQDAVQKTMPAQRTVSEKCSEKRSRGVRERVEVRHTRGSKPFFLDLPTSSW
jgi:hypothetical protein